ncbi:hypothetical protein BaRGS_00016619 [Batillaria attramentaria]|uniref:Uncharacterized protein n=1 Tax=Batillaria attramentaria TaxID=370345 RepID=A0ABD0KZ75_9CAEN
MKRSRGCPLKVPKPGQFQYSNEMWKLSLLTRRRVVVAAEEGSHNETADSAADSNPTVRAAVPETSSSEEHYQAAQHPRYSLRSTVQASADPVKDETTEVSNNRTMDINRVLSRSILSMSP